MFHRQNLYPPKPANAQRGPSPTKSMTTVKKTTMPAGAAKPKTQIVVRCRCAGMFKFLSRDGQNLKPFVPVKLLESSTVNAKHNPDDVTK